MPVGAFMKERQNQDSKVLLLHYCKLHIQLTDAVWKLQVVNMTICPQLHTDLILGLDFLVKNYIVVDAKE
jgi:hypothetical protein